jgi:beta-lactamase regulating signal transducer with metallopeptidase domain
VDTSPLLEALREAASRAPALLLSSAIKGSLVFAAAAAAALLMRRAHPRLRALVWLFTSAAWLLILAAQLAPLPAFIEVANPFRHAGLRTSFSAIVAPREALRAPPVPPAQPVQLVQPADPAPDAPGQRQAAGTQPHRPAARIPVLSLVLAAAWSAGMLLTSARGLLGRIQLARLSRSGRLIGSGPLPALLARMQRRLGIRRRVRIMVSERCRAPFTWRERRPLIMLPVDAAAWTREKARAVLLHELGHVAWHDPLARGFARVVRAVFWFVPFAWIAGLFLESEQEKACDRGAVEAGAGARSYARCLLDFARSSARPLLLESVGLAGHRKRMLEGRIRAAVTGGRALRRATLATAALLLVAAGLVVLGGSATRERLTPGTAWAKLAGTWENTSYPGPQPWVQVLKLRPGFVGEDWLYRGSPDADGIWTVKPKKVWTDPRGNLFLQAFCTYMQPVTASGVPTSSARVLFRLDRWGTTLEANSTIGAEGGTYRQAIDTRAHIEYFSYYFIYRRRT